MINHTVEELETINAVTLTAVTESVNLHKMALDAQRAQIHSLSWPLLFYFSVGVVAAMYLWHKKSGNMKPFIRNCPAERT
jgi:hypothetical protein